VTGACAGNTYFDTTSLTCVSCGSIASARVADNSSRTVFGAPGSCTCRAGFAVAPSPSACDLTLGAGCPADTCTSCAAQGLASSRDRSQCLPCSNTSTLGLDLGSGECACPDGYALIERGPTGLALPAKSCVACPNGTRVFRAGSGPFAPDPYTCASCGDPNAVLTASGECECSAGHVAAGLPALSATRTPTLRCLPQADADAILARYPLAEASTVTFRSLQSSATGDATGTARGLVSAYFAHTFPAAAVGCRGYKPGADPSACQALANLCVLQLYDPTTSACAMYNGMADSRGGGVNGFAAWPATLPFLYWREDLPSILADASLERTMQYKVGTVAGAARRLDFYLAKFALNGTFLGYEKLRSQFAYCAGGDGGAGSSVSIDPPWTFFGHGFTATYSCDVRLLATVGGPPVLYDLYVRDLAADSAASDQVEPPGSAAPPMTLYPVPVRIVNLRSGNGARPNANKKWADEADDVFVNRFMLYDAASGLKTPGDLPEVVRYAVRLSLLIRSTDGDNSKIAPPVLTVEYHERPVAAVMAGSTDGMARDTLVVTAEYASDYSTYSTNILALGAATAVLVCLWASLKITAWIRTNARSQLEATLGLQHVARWLLFVVSAFALGFFWYLVFVTGWWLAYFKLQDSVYSHLPLNRPTFSDNAYRSFSAGIWIVWVAYVVRLAHAIYKQVTVDIFFIDWEKSRGALFRTGHDVESGSKAMAAAAAAAASSSSSSSSSSASAGPAAFLHQSYAPVSAWRTIFAANEWAELSVARRTSVGFTMLLMVVLLEGGHLKYVATPQPYVSDLTPGEINPALQFANNAFWYFVLVGAQLLYAVLLGERYVGENPTTRYIDLVTVMKMSLLLMNEKYHGYYIHGNAPHEHADGTMQDISNHLFEEAAAARVGRGLPGCPDALCQTFELHVPYLWRDQYDRVFRRLLDQESAAVEASMGAGGPGQLQAQQQAAAAASAAAAAAVAGGAHASSAAAAPVSAASIGVVAKARERTRRLAAAQTALMNFMKGFIEETDPDYKRVWRDRTLLQAAFDVPMDMLTEGMVASASAAVTGGMATSGGMQGGLAPSNSRMTYIYMDHQYRFERLLFRGIEGDLLFFELLLFNLVDFLVVNPTVAAVSVFIVAEAIAGFRRWAGDRNVGYKTLVDERFLV
jgi:meckelin